MANKRTLKRTINYICSDLFAECIAASLYSVKTDQENVDALLSAILAMHGNYIRRISHPQPGMEPKLYYKDLINKFNEEATEVIDNINNLG